MRKKILIRCGFGFLVGTVMVMLIPAITSQAPDGTVKLCSTQLIIRLGGPGNALLFSLLLYGFYGAGCMGGTLLYDIEDWSLTRATLVHYLFVSLGYALADVLLCWQLTAKGLLLIEGVMTICFFLVWLILYLYYKAQVSELNRLLEEKKGRERTIEQKKESIIEGERK